VKPSQSFRRLQKISQIFLKLSTNFSKVHWLISTLHFVDMYNSSSGGPGAGSAGGANWNSWGLTNSGSAGSSEYCRFNSLSGLSAGPNRQNTLKFTRELSDDMYNRQSGPGSASGPGAMQPPTGPNAGNSKPPSDYPSAYGGYGKFKMTSKRMPLIPHTPAQLLSHPDIVKIWVSPSSSASH
jgi:hypothetical protein